MRTALVTYKKHIVFCFLSLLVLFFFPLSVFAQTDVLPTTYCLGGCPTAEPSVSESSSSSSTSSSDNNNGNNDNGDQETPTTTVTEAPCTGTTATDSVVQTLHKRHHKRSGGMSSFLQAFLQFLINLINQLLQLIGGGTIPSPSGTGTSPCPSPTVSVSPSPSSSSSSSSSGAQSPTAKPTAKPTSKPATPTTKPTTAPSANSKVTTPSGQAMPGAVSGWKLLFADDFTTAVPVGAFSDCDHNSDSTSAYCGGLKKYGAYYDNWWAYPNTWSDTAKSGADGNTGAPYGGVYHPEDTVSVSSGAMHIKMYRPSSGGDNHVGTVVPKKCMDRTTGRYVERFKVVKADAGFKSAHLFYGNGLEIDYPEGDYTQGMSAFTHPGEDNFQTNAKWTVWHTTAIERTAGKVKYYMDGKLIGTATKSIPTIKLAWVLQNESSIEGPYAKNGATAQLDLDWVACYAPAS